MCRVPRFVTRVVPLTGPARGGWYCAGGHRSGMSVILIWRSCRRRVGHDLTHVAGFVLHILASGSTADDLRNDAGPYWSVSTRHRCQSVRHDPCRPSRSPPERVLVRAAPKRYLGYAPRMGVAVPARHPWPGSRPGVHRRPGHGCAAAQSRPHCRRHPRAHGCRRRGVQQGSFLVFGEDYSSYLMAVGFAVAVHFLRQVYSRQPSTLVETVDLQATSPTDH